MNRRSSVPSGLWSVWRPGWLQGLAIVLVGFGLRLAYTLHASLYIDEFTTIWAAQRVLASGVPRFPSGAIYTQGLIYTYLEALALALGSTFSPLMARLPSLLLSAATLALAVYATRRLFRTWAVGLAALWLALDSEAIVWGARTRTYALLQLLVLLLFLAWYHGAVDGDRPGPRWLAVGLLAAALVDQPLILLLLPPLAILALAARGWGWLRRPVVWLQAGVMVLAVAARWFLYGLMIPAGTTVTAEPRAFVDLFHPLAEWQAVTPFFTDINRLLPALLLFGGAIWLLLCARLARPTWRRPVLAIAFVLAFVVMEMLLAVGTAWRAPRYLYPLLPLLFVGAEGVALPALRALAPKVPRLPAGWVLAGLTVVLALGIVWLAYPSAWSVTGRDEWGYDRAFELVGDAWREGDAVATIAPAAAFVELGRCDYLAVEEGAQALVVERGGHLLDGWTGLPLLDSTAGLAEALEAHPRLWFVADEMRLDRHFGRDYLQFLWDRFDLVAFERGTFVFRSRMPEEQPAVDRSLNIDFADQLRLEGYTMSDDQPEPGETVTVTLRWAPIAPQGEYTAFVHLVSQTGDGIVGDDGPPLAGLYPADRWHRSPRSQPFPDRHLLALPADLPPGRYHLEVGLYRPGTLEPVGERLLLDFLAVGGYAETVPMQPAVARFADGTALYLVGLDGELRPGDTAYLHLAWQVGPDGLDSDYTVFLHLLDTEGQIAQQFDAPPAGGSYPTHYWRPGEVVLDVHDLLISPMLSPGHYHLIGGLYRADGARLLLTDSTDAVDLAAIDLEP